jgi:hypothetical protein
MARGGGGGGAGGGGGGGGRQSDWVCAVCHKFNYGRRNTCHHCENPRQEDMTTDEGGVSQRAVGDSNWRCGNCRTALNFRSRTTCWQCEAPRGGAQLATAGADADVAPVIEREGFQASGGGDGEGESGLTEEQQLERRRKMISYAVGWGAASASDRAAAAAAAGKREAEWICAQCMHKNFPGNDTCFKCFAQKAVAPASRALSAVSSARTKKISKI